MLARRFAQGWRSGIPIVDRFLDVPPQTAPLTQQLLPAMAQRAARPCPRPGRTRPRRRRRSRASAPESPRPSAHRSCCICGPPVRSQPALARNYDARDAEAGEQVLRRLRHLRDHRRPGEGDDLPFALPARAAGPARLPDRRRGGRRLVGRRPARARPRGDRGHRGEARPQGLRPASSSASPTFRATSPTTGRTSAWPRRSRTRRARSSTSRSRRRCSGWSSRASPARG